MSGRRNLKRRVYERDNYTCKYCGLNMRDSYMAWRAGKLKRSKCHLTVDHVLPLHLGGGWWFNNLVVACRPCNEKKAGEVVERQPPLFR